MRIRPMSSLAIAVLALAASRHATADTPDAGASAPARPAPGALGDGGRRLLNGHRFLPTDAMPDPFVTTHFGTDTAFGYSALKVSVPDLPGGPVNLDLKAIALQQRLDVQFGFWNRVGLRMSASGSALSGIDAESALFIGLQAGYRFAFGAVGRLWSNDWVQFAVSFDYGRDTRYVIEPVTAIRRSLERGTLTADGLFTRRSTDDLAPGVQVAFSPYKLLGLLLSLQYDASRTAGAGWGNAVFFGTALSLDLGTLTPVPIGLMGTYVLDRDTTTGATRHHGGGGLFYTGRPDLVLGVEAAVTRQHPAPGTDQTQILANFKFRYYW